MTRLRKDLPDEVVNTLVKELFINTLDVLRKANLSIIAISPDNSIQELLHKDEHLVTDDGTSLNTALEIATMKQPNQNYMLVMPDLPELNPKYLLRIQELAKIHCNLIVPTTDYGTSIALLPKNFFQQDFFGVGSYHKIMLYASEHKVPLSTYYISDLSRDIDTLEDYQYFYS